MYCVFLNSFGKGTHGVAVFISFGILYHVSGPLWRRLLAAISVPRVLIHVCGSDVLCVY